MTFLCNSIGLSATSRAYYGGFEAGDKEDKPVNICNSRGHNITTVSGGKEKGNTYHGLCYVDHCSSVQDPASNKSGLDHIHANYQGCLVRLVDEPNVDADIEADKCFEIHSSRRIKKVNLEYISNKDGDPEITGGQTVFIINNNEWFREESGVLEYLDTVWTLDGASHFSSASRFEKETGLEFDPYSGTVKGKLKEGVKIKKNMVCKSRSPRGDLLEKEYQINIKSN